MVWDVCMFIYMRGGGGKKKNYVSKVTFTALSQPVSCSLRKNALISPAHYVMRYWWFICMLPSLFLTCQNNNLFVSSECTFPEMLLLYLYLSLTLCCYCCSYSLTHLFLCQISRHCRYMLILLRGNERKKCVYVCCKRDVNVACDM